MVQNDKQTTEYFDTHTPEYSTELRLDEAVAFIRRNGPSGGSIIDIGCGTGAVLEYLQSRTNLEMFSGMDISQTCLDIVQTRLTCKVLLGSILDTAFLSTIHERFDYVILCAILHHLIARSRKSSYQLANQAIANAFSLVKAGGHLIIAEPTFSPSTTMDILFYIKKLFTKMTSKRVPVFGYWYNIGAPVVSFYTPEQLNSMIASVEKGRVVHLHFLENKLPLIMRMALIFHRTDATIIVQKNRVTP
jgi:SAM-dependent methyltransferase